MRQTPDSPTDFTSPPKLTPALAKRIEHWPIERLIPYARNARTHSDEQIAQILEPTRLTKVQALQRKKKPVLRVESVWTSTARSR